MSTYKFCPRISPSKWLAPLLALSLLASSAFAGPPELAPGAAKASPAAFPEVRLTGRANGEEAISKLADKLPAVARYYGLSPADFTRLLREDGNAWIDVKGRLLYIDHFPQEADEATATDSMQVAQFPLGDTFYLSSRPGSKRTLYLDFDGHETTGTAWNASSGVSKIISPPYTIDGDPGFSVTELQNIQGMWRQVAEDFAPFDVNVTTQYPGEAALTRSNSEDEHYGMRVLITRDNFENCGCGGFAYLTAFNNVGDYSKPAFVFNTGLVSAGEAISHEAGHTLGLHHDGGAGTGYYTGHGGGETGWAPIMGVGYYRSLVQWSKGEYSGATQGEDDLARISLYGANLLADDHADFDGAASPLTVDYVNGERVFLAGSGSIRRSDDIDVFSFVTDGSLVQIIVSPAPYSPNLDIKADLYDSSGRLLASVNPVDTLSATVNVALEAGEYFVRVDGVGKTPVSGHAGYSDYGSVGRYTVYANVKDPGELVAPVAIAAAPDYAAQTAPLYAGFDGSASFDADGDVVAWNWDFGDGASASGALVNHEYNSPGVYTVTLTVTDNDNLSSSDSLTITVTNQLPVAVASADSSSGTGPLVVNFNGGGSYDPDSSGSIVSYAWDFGDGGSSSAVNPVYTYESAGSFDAVLTVTDNLGARTSSLPVSVYVDPPPYMDHYADGEVMAAGTVSGHYTATHRADAVTQSIRERESGGRKNGRYSYLQHIWTFSVQPGSQASLSVRGRQSSSADGDQMQFAYSVNGGTFQSLPISLGDSLEEFNDIPLSGAEVGGEVRIRVKDSDQTAGASALDTVDVDHIRIRIRNEGGEIQLPDAATGLNATAVSSSQIDLNWTDSSSNETGFRIERSTDSFSWETAGIVGANKQSYSDTGLTAVTQYFYRVYAYNGGGDATSPSNTEVATTLDAPEMYLVSASGYKVQGRQRVALEWSPAGMDVYRDNARIATVAGSSYDDNIGKKGGGSYRYKVCRVGSMTDCSNERTVTF